ncbi:hypothetical protein [Lacticaseibacillus zhaodongensis]|uniref:hypothetical protein n=1 Tax=Lacticaseibacillus zhaodongensis TaxID=2668065 RepID=UPI0012D34B0B|nr:hypothetical protein [Lacticaseibacillus zhaodongensis]
MKKLTTTIYASSGIAVCLLALIDFGISADRTPKHVMMLAGLLILGLMYIGAALVAAFGKRQTTQTRPRLAWPFAALALLLLSVLIGFGISRHPIQLHDIAIAAVLLTVPIVNCVEALAMTRRARQ